MVTLKNSTNRQIEIYDVNNLTTTINSGEVSDVLDETLFTPRTKRLVTEGKLFSKEIVVKPETPVEEVEATEEAVEENTTTSKKKKTTKSTKE